MKPFLKKWLRAGESLDTHDHRKHQVHPWYLVIWLTGVDYFSTLGYQPGIALIAAGALSPIATTVLVLVTLTCALPIYTQVAGRSFVGQGSIAMLENLLPGWGGRILVLVLLGFAGTDFVITMTLSAADAATHATQNPLLHSFLGDAHMTVTLGLLFLLALVFLKGFREAIGLATAVCVPYLLLNVVVLIRALAETFLHPVLLTDWKGALMRQHSDWTGLILASVIVFPKLALGLSGFETGVSVMPLIRGAENEQEGSLSPPTVRIRNTRKLLSGAALIMSVMLILSSFVTTLLVPEAAYRNGGAASGRAIAYLAHEYLGNTFGSIYDLSTILILWFAGASAMAGLLHLIPRYLPRVGLAPEWVEFSRPLVLMLFGFNVVITLIFRGDVERQGAAYATGVLVLMFSAAIAASLSLWRENRRLLSLYGWLVTLVFAYTTFANILERPDGLAVATCFILFILIVSGVSRYIRSTELRVAGLTFADAESEELWKSMIGKKVNLVPIRSLDPRFRAIRIRKIREHYKLHGPLAFLRVSLLDNRSEFLSPLTIQVRQENGEYLVEASQAVAIANAIAYLSEALDPISILLGLSGLSLMRQSFRYFLLGEGEVGLMVYAILQKYWNSTPEEDERPFLYLLSDDTSTRRSLLEASSGWRLATDHEPRGKGAREG